MPSLIVPLLYYPPPRFALQYTLGGIKFLLGLANPVLLWFRCVAPSDSVEILKVAIGSVESRTWWWFLTVCCDRDECEREFELEL
jgi:hypothetical protein